MKGYRFEHRSERLLPRPLFIRRLLTHFSIALAVTLFSLWIGMFGYWYLENMSAVDSFANASMILSGMGPMNPLQTSAGKIFAGCYALYSGLALLVTVGILISPVVHRFLHRFHVEQ